MPRRPPIPRPAAPPLSALIADNRAAGQLDRAIEDVATRTRLEAAAAARQLAAQQPTQLSAGELTPAFDPTTGDVLPDAPAVVPLTDDEAQLREVLRLEAIERRARSLRAGAVVLSYRPPGVNAPPGRPGRGPGQRDPGPHDTGRRGPGHCRRCPSP